MFFESHLVAFFAATAASTQYLCGLAHGRFSAQK